MRRVLPFLALALLLVSLLPTAVAPLWAEAPAPPLIRLKGAQFDPLQGEPNIPAALRAVDRAPKEGAAGVGTYIVQFAGPVTAKATKGVTSLGARLYNYIPDHAYLARMDGAIAAQVAALPQVRWVGHYHPAYALAPDVQRLAAKSSAPLAVVIQALPDSDLEALVATLRDGGAKVHDYGSTAMSGMVRSDLPPALLPTVAHQAGVIWIEPHFESRLFNDVGGGTIMGTNAVRTVLGLYGSGQIVAVADSGLDTGTIEASMSDDFEGRIIEGIAMCAPFQLRDGWSDLSGHGTHVAGSVLGSGVDSGSNPATHSYSTSFAGVAPEADLYFQSIDSDGDGGLECIPSPAFRQAELYEPAYNAGARIHTNSWGGQSGDETNPYGGYNASAQVADQTVWDHKDLLILYAAGNQGVDINANGVIDPDSIGSPGTAKNMITVGAAENERSDQNFTWEGFNYTSEPFLSDLVANDRNGMAAFSSRGPTDDGRIKPEVAAPGTRIISARSHDPIAQTEPYEPNTNYAYSDGTSMATPLTAGAAALVREWLVRVRQVSAPSAALIKALILNGAVDMSPGQYGSSTTQEIPENRPNNVTGWGRVDLPQTINPPAPQAIWYADNSTGLNTGGTTEYTLSVGVPGLQVAPVAQATPQTATQKQSDFVTSPAPAGQTGWQAAAPVAGIAPQGTTQLLQNPGFESGGLTGWQTLGFPIADTTTSAEGSTSARLGSLAANDVNDQVYQAVNIPANTTSVVVAFAYRLDTDETLSEFDLLCYRFANQSSTLFERCIDIGATGPRDWTSENYTLSSSELALVAGQTAFFRFVLTSDFDASSVGWVDATSLTITTPDGETPTPAPNTPTPGPSPTPGVGSDPFRVTLVWSDYPGSTTAAKALVNDLDLEVIGPTGTSYKGNAGVYDGSAFDCLRDGLWDQCNNVETVLIPQAQTGTYRVLVHGHEVDPQQGPQPFALAASGLHLNTSTGACYDFNSSGSVTVLDLQQVAGRFQDPSRYAAQYDVIQNGSIDAQDIQTISNTWNTSC